jgi:uncharacterized protein (TIGR02118 family)
VVKAIILLTRRADMTPDEFRRWWLDEHAPLARGLPGVQRLVFNLVENEDAGYDGVSELWFASRADLEAAYATEHGARVAADTLAHVASRVRLLVDERVQI